MKKKFNIDIPDGCEIVGFDDETKQIIVEGNFNKSETARISIKDPGTKLPTKREMQFLAIQGHPTRGKEVIRKLCECGAINPDKLKGDNPNCYYGLIENYRGHGCYSDDQYIVAKWEQAPNPQEDLILTLEEFEEKTLYNVGDYFLSGEEIWEVVGYFLFRDNRITYRGKRYNEEEEPTHFFPDMVNRLVGEYDCALCVKFDDLRKFKQIPLEVPQGYGFTIKDGKIYIVINEE